MNKVMTVLNDGKQTLVDKEELQFLIATHQVTSFKRSDGWINCGRDQEKMRVERSRELRREDRREQNVYGRDYWY